MHAALAALLLLTALTISTPTLVLKNGRRIAVDAPVRVNGAIVLFRSAGTLYSIPAEEVDYDATRAAANPAAPVQDDTQKLKVSTPEKERLLRELEANHAGTPATKEQMALDAPKRTDTNRGDEKMWRERARAYEEQVQRAKEQLELLRQREADIKAKIVNFLSLGYRPHQFSYETTLLASVEEQIPQAELEVKRAERVRQQFLDDARREGILPGWLR